MSWWRLQKYIYLPVVPNNFCKICISGHNHLNFCYIRRSKMRLMAKSRNPINKQEKVIVCLNSSFITSWDVTWAHEAWSSGWALCGPSAIKRHNTDFWRNLFLVLVRDSRLHRNTLHYAHKCLPQNWGIGIVDLYVNCKFNAVFQTLSLSTTAWMARVFA